MRVTPGTPPVNAPKQTAPAGQQPTPPRLAIDREAEQNAVALDETENEAARHRQIAINAYFRAQRRGFAPGAELDDWLAAEAEYEESLEPDIDPF
jgi:hypothetical protein